MSVARPFSISILVHDVNGLAPILKRLALFCDNVGVFVAYMGSIPERVLKDPCRCTRDSRGDWHIRNFNFLRDTDFLRIRLESLIEQSDLDSKDTLQALTEGGIVKQVFPESDLTDEGRKLLVDIRNALLSGDVKNPEFNRLTGTKPSDYQQSEGVREVTVVDGGGKETRLLAFARPRAISASFDLTTFLVASETLGYAPVLIEPGSREVVKYRYRQFSDRAVLLSDELKSSFGLTSPSARLGEALFLLSDAIFAPDALASRSVQELLEYRVEMTEARQRFVSTHFDELTQLVEAEPWNDASVDRVKAFVEGKLRRGLVSYRDEGRRIRDKLFGDLAVSTAKVAKTAVALGTGSFLMSVAQNTSFVGMLAICALAALANAGDDFIKSLTDYDKAIREHKRNSLAYLAEFK